HRRLLDWLTSMDLWADVEQREESIIRGPLGSLDEKEAFQATWYAEGLAVLAWALNRTDFPKHDVKVDPYIVGESLSFLSEDAMSMIGTATLRSREDLSACRELLYAMHCRL